MGVAQVSGVWGGAAPDPDLGLQTPTGAGRLTLVAERRWAGTAVAIDPYAGRVAVATPSGVMLGVLPDLGAGMQLPFAGIRDVALAPGRRLLVAVTDREVTVLSLDRLRDPPLLRVRPPALAGVAVSPGGGQLALAGRVALPRATVGVWDLTRGAKAWTSAPFGARVAAWVDPYLLAVAGRDLRLYSFDGTRLPVAPAPRGEEIVAIAATREAIMTAGAGVVGTLWNPSAPAAVATLPTPAGTVKSIALSARTAAVGTPRAGGAVALVDLGRRVVDHVLLGRRAAAFGGPWVVVTGRAGTAVYLWEPEA